MRTCIIDNCERTRTARGWCHKHYMHWYQYGDPIIGPPRGKGFAPSDPEQRFLSYIQEKPSGCVEWTGVLNSKGYGRFFVPTLTTKNRMMLAHRWSYSHWKGEIPSGVQVLHHCDNPPCVNPNHLFLGSAVDNMADARIKGRTRNQYGPW